MILLVSIGILILSIVALSSIIIFIFFSLNKYKEQTTTVTKDTELLQIKLKQKYDNLQTIYGNSLSNINIEKNLANYTYEYKDEYNTNALTLDDTLFPSKNITVSHLNATSGETNNINNIKNVDSNIHISSTINVDGLDTTTLSLTNVSTNGILLFNENNKAYPSRINHEALQIGTLDRSFKIYNNDKVIHDFKTNGDVYHNNNLIVDECIFLGDSNNKICNGMIHNNKELEFTTIDMDVQSNKLTSQKINLGKDASDYITLYSAGTEIRFSDNSNNVYKVELSSNVL